MRRELCICPDIPVLNTLTRVILVIHRREFGVPTNTGRLANLALANSKILLRGDLQRPYDLSAHLGPAGSNLLFYPSDDAEVLTAEFAKEHGPCTLIFPDGNWRGAGKMCRRDPVMAGLPKVKLPPGPPSNYRVRKETKEEGLATIEAVARALGIVENEDTQRQLDELLKLMADRTMASRGL